MVKKLRVASIVNIVVNVLLFGFKIIVGLMFGALSIISDAINSFGDIIAAIFIFVSIKINNKRPDSNHEFGHTRAENIAGYTTGILMILLGAYIIKTAIEKLIFRNVIEFSYLMIALVVFTFIIKLLLYFYIKNTIKKQNSPALKANMKDHLNDMILSVGVLIAVIGIKYGVWWIDPAMSLGISIFILKEGFGIVKENANFLMGKCAETHIINEIKKDVLKISEVKNIEKILTQYLGNKIQVVIHIAVDKNLSIQEGHDIGENVRKTVEKIEDINNCFVHIDAYDAQ